MREEGGEVGGGRRESERRGPGCWKVEDDVGVKSSWGRGGRIDTQRWPMPHFHGDVFPRVLRLLSCASPEPAEPRGARTAEAGISAPVISVDSQTTHR